MKHKSLLLILFLSLILRLLFINQTPARLTTDEMSIGYNAYSILKTGKDEWGVKLPLSFRAFGDYKLPGFIYATVPFVATFGLNPISVRLPSIVSGLFIVFGIYLLALALTKHRSIANLAALVTAINPWPIHLSRSGLEANLALAFFVFGLLFLIKAFTVPKKIFILLAGLFFGLTFYTYIAYRLIVVLLILFLFIFNLKSKPNLKVLLLIIATFILTILPLAPHLVDFSSHARFSQISIFTDVGVEASVDEDRAFCYLVSPTGLPKICHLLYHKPQVWLFSFLTNYSRLLLPTFLFIDGDPLAYLNVPSFGEYYLFLLPFYLIGIGYWLTKKTPFSKLFFFIFLLTPIPAALAGEPQIVRASSLIPFISIFIGLGLYQTHLWLKKQSFRYIFYPAFLILGIYSVAVFLVQYWFIYPAQYDNAAYPMPNQVATLLQEKQSNYDLIYFSGNTPDLHIFTAFYLKLAPTWYFNNVQRPEPEPGGFTHPYKLGKFEFGPKEVTDFICSSQPKILYITDQSATYPATQTISSFSGVHPQAKIYDIDLIRQQLVNSGGLEALCQK